MTRNIIPQGRFFKIASLRVIILHDLVQCRKEINHQKLPRMYQSPGKLKETNRGKVAAPEREIFGVPTGPLNRCFRAVVLPNLFPTWHRTIRALTFL